MRDRLFAQWSFPPNALAAAVALFMVSACTPATPPDTLDSVEADGELRTFNAINQLRETALEWMGLLRALVTG